MRDLTEQLAKVIYDTDVQLAIEGGHECQFYRQVGAHQFEITGYEDLPMQVTDSYFEAAEATVKGGVISSFYERTGVRRP